MLRGVVLWRGPSMIDGKNIVLVATLETENPKTGNMIQTWILLEDESPIEAINNGHDESICGSCPLRGRIEGGRNVGRGCYVAIQNAPRAVWSAYHKGQYPDYDAAKHAHLFKGRKIRLGAYGDPVAVPMGVWIPFIKLCDGHTGYTHQWQEGRFWRWKKYLMASTHTIAELLRANAKGWRSFRTLGEDDELHESEIYCPASEQFKDDSGNYKRTCESCRACDGCRNGNIRRNIAITVHGGNKTKNAERVILSLKMVA